jgi:glycogen operon protein
VINTADDADERESVEAESKIEVAGRSVLVLKAVNEP